MEDRVPLRVGQGAVAARKGRNAGSPSTKERGKQGRTAGEGPADAREHQKPHPLLLLGARGEKPYATYSTQTAIKKGANSSPSKQTKEKQLTIRIKPPLKGPPVHKGNPHQGGKGGQEKQRKEGQGPENKKEITVVGIVITKPRVMTQGHASRHSNRRAERFSTQVALIVGDKKGCLLYTSDAADE